MGRRRRCLTRSLVPVDGQRDLPAAKDRMATAGASPWGDGDHASPRPSAGRRSVRRACGKRQDGELPGLRRGATATMPRPDLSERFGRVLRRLSRPLLWEAVGLARGPELRSIGQGQVEVALARGVAEIVLPASVVQVHGPSVRSGPVRFGSVRGGAVELRPGRDTGLKGERPLPGAAEPFTTGAYAAAGWGASRAPAWPGSRLRAGRVRRQAAGSGPAARNPRRARQRRRLRHLLAEVERRGEIAGAKISLRTRHKSQMP
jgi:hypothetical protein